MDEKNSVKGQEIKCIKCGTKLVPSDPKEKKDALKCKKCGRLYKKDGSI